MGLFARAADLWEQQTGANVFTDLGYTPTPRQAEFHAATEFDVLFGGAAGGGKSVALLMHGLRACVQYPGITIGAVRRTYPELEESFLAELRPRLPDLTALYGARYNESKHDLTFPSGSTIRFRHLKNMQDATSRQGGQYQLLLFDERTLTPPAAVSFLMSRLRSGKTSLPVLGVRSGTNPGGIGHGEVKRTYIDATDHGAHVVVDERGRTVRFIQSRLSDNPHVNPEYADDLRALPEAMRKAFLDGDWDSFTGQVFTEWNRERHVVDRQLVSVVVAHATRARLPRISGIDWGWTAPWVCLTAQRDHDGRLWVFRELDGTKLTDEQQAARIAQAEGLDVSARYADPSMWKTTGAGPTTADTYASQGVPIIRADNQRIPGWGRVHHYLGEMPACAVHRAQGWETCPRLHVSDACPNLIRTLPSLPYDGVHVEDVDTNADDHWADALRYLLMGAGAPVALSPIAVQQPQRQHELLGAEL